MSFKPTYWFHENIKLDQEQIQNLITEIDNINLKKFKNNNNNHKSTFFTPDERPEDVLNDLYAGIIEKITKNVGIWNKIKYKYTYWAQLYDKNMSHCPHHHASVELNEIISWVHFLNVPKQKCFQFTDTMGSVFVPEEQNAGDIICFPAWVWHEVLPNNSNDKRLVISGNIFAKHYDIK